VGFALPHTSQHCSAMMHHVAYVAGASLATLIQPHQHYCITGETTWPSSCTIVMGPSLSCLAPHTTAMNAALRPMKLNPAGAIAAALVQ
jgi:hypothetical protein